MSEIALTGCVLTDEQDRVLLLHRRDHMQWQLPGGRIRLDQWEDATSAAKRHAKEEINIDVERFVKIGSTIFEQGVQVYTSDWLRPIDYIGEPLLLDWAVYDDCMYQNLYLRSMGRLVLSPNVRNLVRDLQAGSVQLEPQNPSF